MFRRAGSLCLLVAFGATASGIAQRQTQGTLPSATNPLDLPPAPNGRTGAPPPQSVQAPPQSVQAPPQNAQGPVSTLKATAQLVIVDVVATDNKGAAIHNLKAKDFTVLEDGAPQQISSFEEHAAMPVRGPQPGMPHLPPGIFTNFTPVPAGSAVNVLLLDALNTPMKDQAYVRDQLLEFLKDTPAGTRIAIFGLNDRLIMLQGFTSDLEVLKAVVEKTRPSSSLMLADSAGNGGSAPVSQMITDVAGGAADIQQLLTSVQQFEAVQASTDSQIRAQATLDAMNQLAHFLSGIPGRKNLIWFSGSFPLDVFPQGGIEHPFATVANSEVEFRETTDLLTRSQVAVYPVDARGLQTNAKALGSMPSVASMSNGALSDASASSFESNTNEHMTMNSMAADTGGQAYLDTNGLSKAVGKAIENGSNYYTLSYTPTNSNANGAFRKIQVKLAQSGAELSYRSGYFADDARARPGPTLAGITPAQPSSFIKAMVRGAPESTGILMKLQVLPVSDATENSVAQDNRLSTERAAKAEAKGPYRRYAIDIAVDAKDMQITPTPDGHYRFTAEVLTFVYDAGGMVVNVAEQRARGNLSKASFANMAHVGLPFHLEVSVPVNGEYYLRTAVHDMESDRFGAVEIPVASVAKLAPLNAPAAAAR